MGSLVTLQLPYENINKSIWLLTCTLNLAILNVKEISLCELLQETRQFNKKEGTHSFACLFYFIYERRLKDGLWHDRKDRKSQALR